MAVHFVVALSVLFQFAAALVAFRLIRITGKRASWGLISLAIFLMAIRRTISLFQHLADWPRAGTEFSFEVVGLLISILMLSGLTLIAPLFQALVRNMVELQRAEEATRKNEKKLNDITSHLAEGIYVLDGRGHFSFMNQEAERLTGWTFAELQGKVVHDTIHNRRPDGAPLTLAACPMLKVIGTGQRYSSSDEVFVRKDGTVFPISVISSPIFENDKVVGVVTAFRDISEQQRLVREREELIVKLQESLDTIKTLRGILPICASCKKIRDDQGYWNQIEDYFSTHSDIDFSHGICPDCARKLYPEFYDEQKGEKK